MDRSFYFKTNVFSQTEKGWIYSIQFNGKIINIT